MVLKQHLLLQARAEHLLILRLFECMRKIQFAECMMVRGQRAAKPKGHDH